MKQRSTVVSGTLAAAMMSTVMFTPSFGIAWAGGSASRTYLAPPASRKDALRELPVSGLGQEVELRLHALQALEVDWDSYGASPISSRAVATARDVLLTASASLGLVGLYASPSAIMPLHTGGVQMDWDGDTRSLEVRVSPLGAFSYLAIKQVGSDESYDEHPVASRQDVLQALLLQGESVARAPSMATIDLVQSQTWASDLVAA